MQITHTARWSTHFPKTRLGQEVRGKGKAKETQTNKASRQIQLVVRPWRIFYQTKEMEKLLLRLPTVLAQITWNALPFVDLPIVLNFWYLPSAPITSNRCNPMVPSV